MYVPFPSFNLNIAVYHKSLSQSFSTNDESFDTFDKYNIIMGKKIK